VRAALRLTKGADYGTHLGTHGAALPQ
jgi:hypothetical protein